MAKKKSSNRWIIYTIVALVVIVGVLIGARSAGLIGQTKELSVELAKAGSNSITEKVSASGMVQPVVEVNLSPEVSGELIVLNVEEGDSVVMGQELAKVRPDNFVQARNQAEASLNQQIANQKSAQAALSRSEATFERVKLNFERQKTLHAEQVISDADMELATQNYKVAEKDLESAKQSVEAANYIVKSSRASLAQSQENLRRTTVTAPMSGIVSKLNVEQGETVLGTQQFQGTEIMRIADLDKMEVRVDVNENDIIRVSIGDTAIIDVDSYSYMKKEFKGVVTAIANTANDKASADAVTEFEVRIRIINSSYADLIAEGKRFPFRPGMTASVDIITQRKDNILTVPLAAVTTRDEEKKGEEGNTDNRASNDDVKEVVFINEGGIAKMVEVTTGISDFDNIEIIEGLDSGAEVVTGPFLIVSKRLKDGDAIKSDARGSRSEGDSDEEVASEE